MNRKSGFAGNERANLRRWEFPVTHTYSRQVSGLLFESRCDGPFAFRIDAMTTGAIFQICFTTFYNLILILAAALYSIACMRKEISLYVFGSLAILCHAGVEFD